MGDKSLGKQPPRALSRRRFLRAGTTLGAGAALSPLVLRLTGCGGDATYAGAPQTTAGAGSGGGAGGASGSTGGGGGGTAAAPPSGGGAGGGAGAGASDSGVTDASATPQTDAQAPAATLGAHDVLLGFYPGDGEAALRAAASKLDFSWLSAGQSVLIKVASNSGNPHPSTTCVGGVRAMVGELKARGAGRVIVADQAGVEWVRRSKMGRFSSTRERFQSNGLIALESAAELLFFDDGDFDAGYVKATLPAGHNWPRDLWIAKAVTEVDHLVYMPRLGQHTLAGLTLGQKSAIGFLRDDSRHDLHNDAKDFYAKYAEISYASEIRERLRLCVTVSEKVLLHGGPDDGTVYLSDPPLVIASRDLPNHDALAASVIVTLGKIAPNPPAGMLYNPAGAPAANSFFAAGALVATGAAGPWVSGSPSSSYTAHPFEQGVTKDASTQRGWALSGGAPQRIRVVLDGPAPDPTLRAGIEQHGEGLYELL